MEVWYVVVDGCESIKPMNRWPGTDGHLNRMPLMSLVAGSKLVESYAALYHRVLVLAYAGLMKARPGVLQSM